jgi:hypothetical protein
MTMTTNTLVLGTWYLVMCAVCQACGKSNTCGVPVAVIVPAACGRASPKSAIFTTQCWSTYAIEAIAGWYLFTEQLVVVVVVCKATIRIPTNSGSLDRGE